MDLQNEYHVHKIQTYYSLKVTSNHWIGGKHMILWRSKELTIYVSHLNLSDLNCKGFPAGFCSKVGVMSYR